MRQQLLVFEEATASQKQGSRHPTRSVAESTLPTERWFLQAISVLLCSPSTSANSNRFKSWSDDGG